MPDRNWRTGTTAVRAGLDAGHSKNTIQAERRSTAGAVLRFAPAADDHVRQGTKATVVAFAAPLTSSTNPPTALALGRRQYADRRGFTP